MDKKTYITLTTEELQQIVENYTNLIWILEGKSPTNNLKRELARIFRWVPANVETSGNTQLRGSFLRYQIVKRVGNVSYDSEGTVTVGYSIKFDLKPWQPDKDIREKYDSLVEAARQNYENQPTAEELAEEDIKAVDKKFWSSLNKRNNLCLKYQVYKLIGKPFKVPRRFVFEDGKSFWEIADLLEERMDAAKYPEDVLRSLEDTVRTSFDISGIEQLISSRRMFSINLPYFQDISMVQEAYNKRALILEVRNQHGWLEREVLCKEYYLSVSAKFHKNHAALSQRYSTINSIIDLNYALKNRKKDMPPEIVEFFEVIGLIKPEEEEKAVGNDV